MQRNQRLINIARTLRRDLTPPERALWAKLRGGRLMGVKFARQVPIGPYVADFAARQEKLIIELDGDSHAFQAEYDRTRTSYLITQGYRVLRFSNADIGHNLDGICDTILHELGRI